MACSLNISNVVATTSGASLASLTVHGTATDCTEIEVSVTCGSTVLKKLTPGSPPNSSGNWTVVFSAAELAGFTCPCGSAVRVDARCGVNPGCSTWAIETIQCCPTIDIVVEQGDCQADGTKQVTVSAAITPGPNSNIPVQADLLLNGSVVGSGTSTSPFTVLTLSYSGALASGNHSACVQVNQPDCGTQCTPFSFNCRSDAGESSPECTKTYKRWFCPLLFLIVTLSFAVALAFLILSSCAPLAALGNIGTGFLVTGLLAFAAFAFFPDCRKCVCGWAYRLFGRVFIAAGLLVAAFAAACPPLLVTGLILVAVGLGFLLLWQRKCRKTACELIKEALFVIVALVQPAIMIVQGAGLAGYVLILFVLGGFAFTFVGLILVVLALLYVYNQIYCN